MKPQVLIVLCVCSMQICFGAVKREIAEEEKNYIRKRMHEIAGDVSERFIDDLVIIFDKFDDQRFLTKAISKVRALFEILEHGKISKIDANSIKKFKSENELLSRNPEKLAAWICYLQTYQSIFTKYLSLEIANGMTNLMYATTHPNATAEEIENALNYLYSNETTVIQNPFRNIPLPTATDCPKNMERYTAVQDKLKLMTDIKPVVLQNVDAIIEKFPCNDDQVPTFLEDFVQIIRILKALAEYDKRSIGACVVKEISRYLNQLQLLERGRSTYGISISREDMGKEMKAVETILATRLPDESFHGIIDFEKAAILETPTDEIQKALEYVFIDVAPPMTNCSTEQ